MTPFVNTFALIAWLNPRDHAHSTVRKFMEDFQGRLVTTEWVLMEVADALANATTRDLVVKFLRTVRSDPSYEIVGYSDPALTSGFNLFCARPDKEWSLTDCISFSVMADRGLKDALTGDHHFTQAGYRAVFSYDE